MTDDSVLQTLDFGNVRVTVRPSAAEWFQPDADSDPTRLALADHGVGAVCHQGSVRFHDVNGLANGTVVRYVVLGRRS